MPKTLGNLYNLKTLNLKYAVHNDNLTEFGQVLSGYIKHNLEELILLNNGFSGHIPVRLGSLRASKVLLLSANYLDGPIPASKERLSVFRTIRPLSK